MLTLAIPSGYKRQEAQDSRGVQHLARSPVRDLAHMPVAGARRTHRNLLAQTRPGNLVPEHRFRQRRPAEAAKADHQNTKHTKIVPRATRDRESDWLTCPLLLAYVTLAGNNIRK